MITHLTTSSERSGEVTCGGKSYAAWIASGRPDGPDADDEMILEVVDLTEGTVFFVSHFGSTGELKLTAKIKDIPVELIEWAIDHARRQWSDRNGPNKGFPTI